MVAKLEMQFVCLNLRALMARFFFVYMCTKKVQISLDILVHLMYH